MTHAALITGAGYAFGVAISAMIDDLKIIEELVLLLIVASGLAFWLWRRRRARTQQAGSKAISGNRPK